tara:strand:+ start:2659 stop:2925 length:267 start_codon:yes stop_codon:yes gene_type:complete
MSDWRIQSTDTFLKNFKKNKNNAELLNQLDKVIIRFKENPHFGKQLSGPLKGRCSTRLLKNFRLIFSIDEEEKCVYLEALDHRKDIYD